MTYVIKFVLASWLHFRGFALAHARWEQAFSRERGILGLNQRYDCDDDMNESKIQGSWRGRHWLF